MNGNTSRELIYALIAIGCITAGYVFFFLGQDSPRPSSAVGYVLGVTGFLMMLSTETLYSLRKRLPGFHLGRMSLWLEAHVFTGLVGPYLVLLHSGWRFQGVAGLLTLITAVVVVSGAVGRYVYTAVPRSLDGVEIGVIELEGRISQIDRELQEQGIADLGLSMLSAIDTGVAGWRLVLFRPWIRWRQRWKLGRLIAGVAPEQRDQANQLRRLLTARMEMLRQMRSLEATRRLLAWWHVLHVPLSAGLFVLAFVHIGAALYYALFMR